MKSVTSTPHTRKTRRLLRIAHAVYEGQSTCRYNRGIGQGRGLFGMRELYIQKTQLSPAEGEKKRIYEKNK